MGYIPSMPFILNGDFSAYSISYLLQKAWLLRARCSKCHHEKRWYAEDLRGLPGEALLPDIAGKLKCSVCGSTEGLIDLLQDHAEAWRLGLGYKPRKE
jgi:hypothetical protein